MTVWRKVLPGVAVGGLLLPLALAAPAPADASPATTVPAAATSTVVDGLPAVIPQPTNEVAGTGPGFTLDGSTTIVTTGQGAAVTAVAHDLADLVRPASGLPLPVSPGSADASDAIVLDDSGADSLGSEGYTLHSDDSRVVIQAHTAEGLFHGVQTLRQLLPTQVESATPVNGVAWTVPAASITDTPRYSYRGIMVDTGRHFFTVAEVERIIDQAAMYKLNVLHLHLTEDIGWRIAIDAYPDLTTVGSNLSGGPGYYTQQDYRDIVAYAAAHYIEVVPEVDGPAHSSAAVTAMATGSDPADIPIDPANPADNANVDTFLTTVVAEIGGLSSSQYFHIGGDESGLPATQYDHWVTSAANAAVAAGKTAMGWSQIGADPGVPGGSILQYWSTRSGNDTGDGLAPGLRKGDKLVLSPYDGAYFDYKYDADTPKGVANYTPLSKAYSWNPADVTAGILSANGLASTITDDPTLGVEATLWTDTLGLSDSGADSRQDYADFMLLPRLPALAELGWSPWSTHDWNNFAARVATQGQRWADHGYNFYASPEVQWPGFVQAPVLTYPPAGAAIPFSPARLAGTGPAGDTVTVTEGSTTVCSTTVDTDGNWSCVPAKELTGGSHQLSLVASDADGNHSKPTAATITIGAPTLADNWKLDEEKTGVGSTIEDAAGGQNGTVTGSTTLVPGKVGDSASFDGTASPITTSLADLPAPWSVGVWVNPTGTTSSANIINSATSSIKLQQSPSTGKVGVTRYRVADYTVNYTAPLNSWTYLTVVDDGSAITVYANGGAVGTIDASMPLGRTNIGSTAADPARAKLDELTVFDRALGADQVSTLYTAAGTGGTGGLPGLVDDWTMTASGGHTVLPDSAGGQDATLTGSTALVAGKVGKAAAFDGSNSPLTTTLPDLPAPWSLGLWVKPTGTTSSANIIGGSASSLKLQQYPSTGKVGVTQYGSADYTSGYAAPLDTWTYLTLVDDGHTIGVYANGKQVDTIKASVALGRSLIGSTSRDPAKEQLDEISVFGNALTANQVSALYAAAGSGGTDAGGIGWGPAAGGVYALAGDGADCHVRLNGTGEITADAVSVNGTSDHAVCLGAESSIAGDLTVQGGVHGTGGIAGTVHSGAPATADPFAGLPEPTTTDASCPGAACPDGTKFTSGHTYRLLPGTYNTTLNLNGGATVCLAPGIYVLKSTWNLNTALLSYGDAGCPGVPAGVTDPGVLLYFAQGHLQLNGGGSVSGLAPVQTGPYAGMLYWQADDEQTTLGGSSGVTRGGWYQPNGALVLNGEATLRAPFVAAAAIAVNGEANLIAANPSPSYNGLALTPPMGWNDWDYYQCNLDESLILQQARALVDSGMAAAGYDNVNLDDCWMQTGRDADGNLQANTTKFPHGIEYVADNVHAMGLKFGIYVDSGTSTCGGYAGSQGYEAKDARLFAQWGVDYIKVDGCNVRIPAGQTKLQTYEQIYSAWSKALIESGRPMVFSASLPAYFQGSADWNTSIAYTSHISNLWREGTDAAYPTAGSPARWNSIINNYSYNVGLSSYTDPARNAGPGHWNDPDFLVTGGPSLSDTEMQSQILLWAEMAAPLISSTDITKLTDNQVAMLTNRRVIAVDQDPLGRQGTIVASGNGYDVLAKPLADGDVAIVLFNKSASPQTISTSAANVGLASGLPYRLTDLVTGTTSTAGDTISASVPSHGAVMYRATPTQAGTPAAVVEVTAPTPGLGEPQTVTATLTNIGTKPISGTAVTLAVPDGWTSQPASHELGTVVPGATVARAFTVTKTSSSSGVSTATGTVTVGYLGPNAVSTGQTRTVTLASVNPYATLADAFNNVGVTTVDTRSAGNIDGAGDSYSAEQLAAAGLTPGVTVNAQGATFTWPDVTPGSGPDNVLTSGQHFTVSGKGSRLAFLGTEAAAPTTAAFTVTYTDGTTSTGQLGFPNWTTSTPTQFGAVPVVTVHGRNTPAGFANQDYAYSIYYNSLPTDPAKTVASVTFPSSPAIHIFAMSLQ